MIIVVFERIIFLALAFLLLFFIFVDVTLYSRVHNYSIGPSDYKPQYKSWIPCWFNPLCVITVKALMLDHLNYYLLSPLSVIIDQAIGISDYNWISPNLISGFHIFVAIIAGKCASSSSLSVRRSAVLIFQVRNWLDDLDGHVARKREQIKGEYSDVGSVGYFVDGMCDALGCIALMIGIFLHFQKQPPARGYEKLKNAHLPLTNAPDVDLKIVSRWRRHRDVIQTMMLFVGYLLMSSIAWNRYIFLYQNLLENNGDCDSTFDQKKELNGRQAIVLRSCSFWAVSTAWKLINFHAAINFLLLAMFFDRLWEYMRMLRWFGYIIVFGVTYFSESHFLEHYAFIHDTYFITVEASDNKINM